MVQALEPDDEVPVFGLSELFFREPLVTGQTTLDLFFHKSALEER